MIGCVRSCAAREASWGWGIYLGHADAMEGRLRECAYLWGKIKVIWWGWGKYEVQKLEKAPA